MVQVSVGSYHVLALTHTGEVLSVGNGVSGKLGHGDEAHQRVPKVIEALRGVRVVAIAAGGHHSTVLTDEGSVLSFGQGLNGQLGHANLKNQFMPKVIAVLQAFRR